MISAETWVLAGATVVGPALSIIGGLKYGINGLRRVAQETQASMGAVARNTYDMARDIKQMSEQVQTDHERLAWIHNEMQMNALREKVNPSE